jgi:hypothetical protein
MTTEQAEAVKFKEGNDAFKNGNWDSAAKLYTKAIKPAKNRRQRFGYIFEKSRRGIF